ncbi:Microfibrillar-associated protein 1 [Nowakowskiella sp. JEL0407]|nr:Microfibrillar-associated protein 1 [Nowakowskiella sp. JEL0407]
MAPKVAKVHRYRAGKLPKGVDESALYSDDSDTSLSENDDIPSHSTTTQLEVPTPTVTHNDAVQNDKRLQRLLNSRINEDTDSADENTPENKTTEKDEEEEDDEAIAQTREKRRLAALARMKEEEENTKSDDEEEGESESEYTTESEEEEQPQVKLKPIFIPKAQRDTILEKERLEKQAEEAEKKRLQILEARVQESHHLVAEVLSKELEAAKVVSSHGFTQVDDTDGLNEEEEYEAWKLRELKRIKRDREAQKEREFEIAEKERRSQLSEAELIRENLKIKPEAVNKKKQEYTYLQRYYHKGAFFLDDELVKKREVSAPTLEDRFDKSVLPEVMQVKNFGRAGRTKWTHLAKEDTSKRDVGWNDKEVFNKIQTKMGGMKQSFDKPTSKKRKTD